ncbi:hypothetical protein TNCV_1874211 [Trichonephila clavipes]|nr:hypothetical protein TNCV_1874211 [Trichonephila clavipes]
MQDYHDQQPSEKDIVQPEGTSDAPTEKCLENVGYEFENYTLTWLSWRHLPTVKATKSRQTRMTQQRKPLDPHDPTLKPSDLHDATATTHTLTITILFARLSTDSLVGESVAVVST